MFFQDALQVPMQQAEKLDKKYSISILKKIGAKNIRTPKDHYFERTDIRRFFNTTTCYKKKNLISKILYGEHLKFTFDKENNSMNLKENDKIGKYYDIAKNDLFSICRSITGEGVRKTLKIIKKEFPNLKIKKVRIGY